MENYGEYVVRSVGNTGWALRPNKSEEKEEVEYKSTIKI